MSRPSVKVPVEPGSRLEELLATYSHMAPEVAELNARFESIKTAIKAEVVAAAPGAQAIDVEHEMFPALRVSYVESWRVDAKRLKAEDPATYVRFAVKGGSWQLRAVAS